MPGGLAGTAATVAFLAGEVARDTYVNLMDQYRPCHRADRYPEIARRPSDEEMDAARAAAHRAGITRLDDRVRRRVVVWR
jgi:putative pyruvate formate lyase activating enzyme